LENWAGFARRCLNYISDVSYRRHILTQLNRHESRNGLARHVFHGQKGELRQRYREGQEDQLGALGLVVNALILWTTRYMNAALNHLRDSGYVVDPDDEKRLPPLGCKYFHVQDSVKPLLKHGDKELSCNTLAASISCTLLVYTSNI